MSSLLNENVYLVKQHIGMFKAENSFDVYNPETSKIILFCREENLSGLTKFFRFTKYKQYTPFNSVIRTENQTPIIYLNRKASLGFSPVIVHDSTNKPIGKLQPKFRLGGAKLEITDMAGKVLAVLTGSFIGWDFKIRQNDEEIAIISKKWAGVGKELFSQADNYVLQINDKVPADSPLRPILLSAVLCIDFLLKND
jgi:hypothetical protein